MLPNLKADVFRAISRGFGIILGPWELRARLHLLPPLTPRTLPANEGAFPLECAGGGGGINVAPRREPVVKQVRWEWLGIDI